MALKEHSAQATPKHHSEQLTSELSHTDPVCGMTVEPQSAAGSHEYEGKRYFFCSQHCLEKFRAEPARYIIRKQVNAQKESEPRAEDKANTYTCPMHPEVRQQGPGYCPECGMALEAVTITA